MVYKNRVPKYSDSYYNFYNWYFRYDFDRNRWMNTLLNHEKLIVELSLDNKITRKEAEYIIEKLNPEEICRVLTMISRWHKIRRFQTYCIVLLLKINTKASVIGRGPYKSMVN